MGEETKIEWCHHTFNPWIGCSKVSAGCTHCYAEELMDRRYGRVEWGPKGTRSRTAASNWKQPLKWNREAGAAGERRRVFCASLADVFEDRPELDAWRQDLFDLILSTPNLDWLLLTKRPEVMADWLTSPLAFGSRNAHEWGDGWPNVWLGTSVEDQAAAKARIPILLSVPAAVHWLSVEPLLGPVDLEDYLHVFHGRPCVEWPNGPVDWVIVGAESGAGARPMHEDWVRSVRDQCSGTNRAFFYKQKLAGGHKVSLPELDGRRWAEFPASRTEVTP